MLFIRNVRDNDLEAGARLERMAREDPENVRAAALCVAEVGLEAVPGEEDLVVVRPRLLLLLVPLLVRTPLDGSGGGGGGGGGGGASFSPSERYMPIDDERRAEKVDKL